VAVVCGVDDRIVIDKIIEGGGEKGEREIRTFWDDIREEALREGLQQGLQQGLLLSAQEMVLEALEENTQANDSHKFP